jgi:RNA ligase (TIGR02306 family)
MRKLASIKKIDKLEPIEGADRIELATIGGWKVVVAKDVGHQEGDSVVYCEIDSFLPIEPEFEFLRKSSYKKLVDGTEGFRLKTIRLRGQYSQGLILPLKDAVEVMKRKGDIRHVEPLGEGDDVTEMLGIIKWDPPIPANLAGVAKGNFPSFLQKTDEERVQNLKDEYETWKGEDHQFYVTEKLDGSSATFYYRDGEFGVCSRNLELERNEDNTFWKVAKELDLEAKLAAVGKNICIQGELIGEGVQKNRYKIKGQTVRFFNVFDIDSYERMSYGEMTNLISEVMELQMVPVAAVPGFKLPDTIEDLLVIAEAKSIMNDKAEREGIVIRSADNKISFKAISNKFLLKSE